LHTVPPGFRLQIAKYRGRPASAIVEFEAPSRAFFKLVLGTIIKCLLISRASMPKSVAQSVIKRLLRLEALFHRFYQRLAGWTVHTAVLIVLTCSTASSATFTLGQSFPAQFPADPAIADLNGDGKSDFIVGGYSISVYLGNGDGTFTLKQQFNVEGYHVQIGDLNGDGIPDFATSTTAGVQIYLGNGDGSFRTGQPLVVANVPAANPAFGDFNHDGALDLALASSQTNQIQIFFGNGDGTFRSPVVYATGVSPQFTLVVDLNHDGNLDLAVTCNGDPLFAPAGISVLLGNIDGTFGPESFTKQPDYTLNNPSRPDYIAAADFDGDGNIDLLVQAIEDPTTYVFYGSGAGSFEAIVGVPTNALGEVCLAGDFDGDGQPDIVCAGNGFTIVTNTGNRTFSSTTYFPGSFSAGAAGDFNQDGKLDLVMAAGILGQPTPSAAVFLNSRAPTQTIVSVDQSSPQYGQLSHLTVAVNTALDGINTGCFSTCPTGSVTWFDGNVTLATAPLALGPDHSGTAAYDTYFSGGSHTITASYTGRELPSISNAVVVQVFPAPASLAVSASPASPVYGAGATISVVVSVGSPSLAVPTGTVTIQDNGTALATLPLNASGQASITSMSISGGNHTLQAKYSGDANYLTAVATTALAVQPATVQLTLACKPNPAASDEALSCIAQLAAMQAAGTITIEDGAKALGSAIVADGQAVLNIGTLAAGTHTLQANYSGDSNFAAAQSLSVAQAVTPATRVIATAAADGNPVLAPQAISAAYGVGFAEAITLANPGPLPITLAGVRMTITDAAGSQQAAPLFFVSSKQINFLTPNVASGPGRLQINNAEGALFTGPLTIQPVAPALFSANGDGKGVAAAYVVHVGASGVQSTQAVFACGNEPGSCIPVPINLGQPTDQNFLVLYGSGIRNASKVSVLFEGTASVAVFFGPQGQFAGLDQVNVAIPADLAGHGDVQIVLTADGRDTNQLMMQVK
jgi:uncharacterized protein (TIGR03437 family)